MESTVPPSEAAVAAVGTQDRTVAILSYITISGCYWAATRQRSDAPQEGIP
jgi:hypothetical protein